MQCITCGVKLPPGISTCFYCGTPTPYNAGNTPNGPSQVPGRPPQRPQPYQGNNASFPSFSGVEQAAFPGSPQPEAGNAPMSPSPSELELSPFAELLRSSQPKQPYTSQQSPFHGIDLQPFPAREHTSGLTSLSPNNGPQSPGGAPAGWQAPNTPDIAQQAFPGRGQQQPHVEPTSQISYASGMFSQAQPATPPPMQSPSPQHFGRFGNDDSPFQTLNPATSQPSGAMNPFLNNNPQSLLPMSPSPAQPFGSAFPGNNASAQAQPSGPLNVAPGGVNSPFSAQPSAQPFGANNASFSGINAPAQAQNPFQPQNPFQAQSPNNAPSGVHPLPPQAQNPFQAQPPNNASSGMYAMPPQTQNPFQSQPLSNNSSGVYPLPPQAQNPFQAQPPNNASSGVYPLPPQSQNPFQAQPPNNASSGMYAMPPQAQNPFQVQTSGPMPPVQAQNPSLVGMPGAAPFPVPPASQPYGPNNASLSGINSPFQTMNPAQAQPPAGPASPIQGRQPSGAFNASTLNASFSGVIPPSQAQPSGAFNASALNASFNGAIPPSQVQPFGGPNPPPQMQNPFQAQPFNGNNPSLNGAQPFNGNNPQFNGNNPSLNGAQPFAMGAPQAQMANPASLSPMGSSPSITMSNRQPQPLPGGPPLSGGAPSFIPPGAPAPASQDDASANGALKKPVLMGIALVVVLIVVFGGYFIVQSAGKTPLPTAQVQASPTVTLAPITTTDPKALYTQATARKAILTDSLASQGANGWTITSATGNCAFSGGAMHLSGSSASKVISCAARNTPNFTNFAYQVQATAISGDTVGVIFRADSMGRKLYLFSITTQGVYLLSTYNQSSPQIHIIAGGTSNAINKGQNKANQIAVIARGTTIYLYVNQQFITKVDDTSSNTGLVGTLVGDTQGGNAEAAFKNAQVWSV